MDKEEIYLFLYSEKDFQDTLPYEESLAIYQNKLLDNSIFNQHSNLIYLD